MHSPDDELLRSAFDELRRADRAQTPSFERVLRRPARRSRRLSFAIAACVLLVIVAASIVKFRPRRAAVTAIPAHWSGPTDFLLRTPGRDFGGSVPQLSSPVPQYSLKGDSK